MIDQIIKWQKDRNLDKMPYNHYDETLNLLEEICEMWGLNREFAVGLCDIIEANGQKQDDTIIVDGLFDLGVYGTGAQLKLGFNPIEVNKDGLKEINDRTGAYDPKVGKWVKQPKKENAYKADYSKAKL